MTATISPTVSGATTERVTGWNDALMFPGLVPSRFTRVQAFLDTSPQARNRMTQASDVLGYDLAERYATAGVSDMEVFQMAFLAIGVALTDWGREEHGLDPEIVLGQSFGGFLAAVHVASFSYEDMVDLLRRSIMVENDYFQSLPTPLECTFFFGIEADHLEELCAAACEDAGEWASVCVSGEGRVCAASGTAHALGRLRILVRRNGGRVLHTIARAEHCPGVAPLVQRLRTEVYADYTVRPPDRVLLSDTTGERLVTAEQVQTELLAGWTTPLTGHVCFDALTAHGVGRLVVPGPKGSFGRMERQGFTVVQLTPNQVDGRMEQLQ